MGGASPTSQENILERARAERAAAIAAETKATLTSFQRRPFSVNGSSAETVSSRSPTETASMRILLAETETTFDDETEEAASRIWRRLGLLPNRKDRR